MSKKHAFEGKKHVFLTKNGLINSGLMSIKQSNQESQPLEQMDLEQFLKFVSIVLHIGWMATAAALSSHFLLVAILQLFSIGRNACPHQKKP